jgi:hypothetical protein
MFESLDTCELKTLREDSSNRIIIDKIINNRHLYKFGTKGETKPFNLKIKDLLLADIVKKVNTSIFDKGGKLRVFWNEMKYGLFVVTGGEVRETYRTLFGIRYLAFYNPDENLMENDAIEMLLRQKNILLEFLPKFKADIVNNYYLAIKNLAENNNTVVTTPAIRKKFIMYAKQLDPDFDIKAYNNVKKHIELSGLEKEIIKLSGYDKIKELLPKALQYHRNMFCGFFPHRSSKVGGYIYEYITGNNAYLINMYGDNYGGNYCDEKFKYLKLQIQYDQRLSDCDREILKEYVNYKLKQYII